MNKAERLARAQEMRARAEQLPAEKQGELFVALWVHALVMTAVHGGAG